MEKRRKPAAPLTPVVAKHPADVPPPIQVDEASSGEALYVDRDHPLVRRVVELNRHRADPHGERHAGVRMVTCSGASAFEDAVRTGVGPLQSNAIE